MKISWRTEIASWAILAAMFVLAATAWSWAPDQIPTHWNLQGQADGYSGKAVGLFLFPCTALAVYLLLLLLPLIDPKRLNYQKFAGTYRVLRVALIAFFGVIYGIVQLSIRGRSALGTAILPLAIGALFVVLGNYMGKIRPNWFIGVRTPWTLSSPRVWTKTHRQCGWAFVIAGILVILTDLLMNTWTYYVLLGTAIASVLYAYAYSYFAWRAEKSSGGEPGFTLGGDT